MKAIIGAFHWNFTCKDGFVYTAHRDLTVSNPLLFPNTVGIDHIHDYMDKLLWKKKSQNWHTWDCYQFLQLWLILYFGQIFSVSETFLVTITLCIT